MTPSLVAKEFVGALIVTVMLLPLTTVAVVMTAALALWNTTALAVEPLQGF
jgi:hypothetical protein